MVPPHKKLKKLGLRTTPIKKIFNHVYSITVFCSKRPRTVWACSAAIHAQQNRIPLKRTDLSRTFNISEVSIRLCLKDLLSNPELMNKLEQDG